MSVAPAIVKANSFNHTAAGAPPHTIPDSGRAKLLLCLDRSAGERRGISDRTSNSIASLVFAEIWASRQRRPTTGKMRGSATLREFEQTSCIGFKDWNKVNHGSAA
jgi:hypothetical protein